MKPDLYSRIAKWSVWAAMLVVLAWVFVVQHGVAIWGGHQQYDDSYITYRYALNLAHGYGLVFNPGEAADSATSFTYTVLLALLYKVGLANLEHVALVIGMAACAWMVWEVAAMLGLLTGWRLLAAAVAMVGVGSGMASGWALQGMETPFFAALLLFTVNRALVLQRDDWWVALWLLLTALSRPEGLLVIGVYGLSRIDWQNLRRLLSVAGWKELIWRERYGIAALAGTAVFYVSKWVYYDHTWVSMAGQLKSVVAYYDPQPAYMLKQWQNHMSVLWVGAVIALVAYRHVFTLWYSLLVALLAGAYMFGMHSDFVRYGTTLTPLLVMPAAYAWVRGVEWVRGGSASVGRVFAGAGLVLVFTGAFWQSWESSFWFARQLTSHPGGTECRIAMGRWLRDHAGNEAILGSDIGAVAYAAWPLKMTDVFGLTSRPVFDRVMAGRNKDDLYQYFGQALIADTWHGTADLLPEQRMYPFYKEGNPYRIASPASALVWKIDEAPLMACQSGVKGQPEIGVRRVRWRSVDKEQR